MGRRITVMTLSSLVLACAVSIAGLAAPHIPVHPHVVGRVLVALWAVGDGGGAHLIRSDSRRVPISAPQVFLQGDGFKVAGVYATADAAKMVKLEAFWNRPNVKLIRKTVSLEMPGTLLVSVEDGAISANVERSRPQPASTLRNWQDTANEAIHDRNHSTHGSILRLTTEAEKTHRYGVRI